MSAAEDEQAVNRVLHGDLSAFEEIVRQRGLYRGLGGKMSYARIVDTSVSVAKTIDEVTDLILGQMSGRITRRYRTR